MKALRAFTLAHGLVLSTLIHAAPVVGWVIAMNVPPPTGNKVKAPPLDLFGVISTRQVEARQASAPVVPQPVALPKQTSVPEPKPKQKTVAPKKPKPNSVVVKREKPPPRAVAPQPYQPPAPTPIQASQIEQAEQVPQTIKREELEAAQSRQYGTELGQIIRSRLVYPLKAKAKGLTGECVIAFTVEADGSLAKGSETIRKSTGYAELDEAALRAVRAGKFPKPPRRMNSEVYVPFRVSSAK